MRGILLLAGLIFICSPCLAQRRAAPKSNASDKKGESKHFQNLIAHSKLPYRITHEKETIEASFDPRITLLKQFQTAAKAGRVTDVLHPDRWELFSAGRGKSKYQATFRDGTRRKEVEDLLEASIKTLEADKADLLAAKAILLHPINLKSDFGYLESAKLLEILGPTTQLWEVNEVAIVVKDFNLTQDGQRTDRPDGARSGEWYQFAKYDWPPIAFAREADQEVDLDGKKSKAPAFRRLSPEAFPDEEKKAGARLLIVDDRTYDLNRRQE